MPDKDASPPNLTKQLASHAMDLWLVEETSRYMFRLLAAKEIFNNPQRYGFLLKREHLYPPIPYKEVTVTTSIDDLNDYAKSQGITYAQLRDANPWLRDTSLKNKTGKTYTLYIPTQEGMYYDPKKTVAYNKQWVLTEIPPVTSSHSGTELHCPFTAKQPLSTRRCRRNVQIAFSMNC